MGLSLYVENGRYGGYKILSQNLLTPIYFNSNEMLAIFFALKSLDLLSSTPFEKSYKQIREKLYHTIPTQLKSEISTVLNFIQYYNASTQQQTLYLSDILDSIIHEYTLHISYNQYQCIETDIQVYELFYRNGVWFCSALDIPSETWGIYRCDCILELQANTTDHPSYARSTLAEFQTQYEDTYHDIPFKCKLSTFGVELFTKNHYPNMELQYIDGSPYIVGGYNIDELDYMTHYLMSLGTHVDIIYPEQLKKSYLHQMQSIIARYH